MRPKTDISNRADIDFLITEFYNKLMVDDLLSHFFTQVVKIDLPAHIPVIADFWDNILFDSMVYRRNAMNPHITMGQKSPMEHDHFERWLNLFHATINEHFSGEKADLAINRSKSIALLMEHKVNNESKNKFFNNN